jgi:hypothetical protein
MVAFSHHIKQNKSIVSISHCIELTAAVSLGFIYKQFKNITNKQTPFRTILPHTIMAAPLVKKFLVF